MDGWKTYELGELLLYEQPTKYIVKSTDYDDSYATPVLTAGKSFILGYTSEEEGLYPQDGLPVIIFDDFTTSSKYVDFPFKVKSSAMKILIPNTELVLPKYIFYRMQLIQFDHSTHKRYWIQQYSKLKVTIPDIDEQKRVVREIEERLSQLDNGEQMLQKAKQQLKVYRQSILMNVFSTYSVGEKEYTTLGEVIDVLTDYHANGSYESLKANVKLLDEPNYAIMIRSTNFEQNDFTNNLKYIDEHSYNFLKKSQLFGGEVLMGKIGNAGRVYYMKDLGRPMSLAMNMFAMRFKKNVLSKYVYYYLLQPLAQKDIKQYVKGVGTPTIDKKSVRSLKFDYHISLDTQKAVVRMIEYQFSVCDDIEKTIENTLQQTEAMRQSILKAAFEGRF